MHGDDDTLLRFLAEMVHPAVRPDEDETRSLVESINKKLGADGWALVEVDHISGHPIFAGRRSKGIQPTTALKLPEYERLRDPQVFHEHLRRIDAGLAHDPPAAIASSKELVESICKVIPDDYDIEYGRKEDLLDLYKAAAKALKLSVDSVPDSAKGSQAAQRAARALASAVQSLAELRNELGLGHGRNVASKALTRHARLAFNSASAVAEFRSTLGINAVAMPQTMEIVGGKHRWWHRAPSRGEAYLVDTQTKTLENQASELLSNKTIRAV